MREIVIFFFGCLIGGVIGFLLGYAKAVMDQEPPDSGDGVGGFV